MKFNFSKSVGRLWIKSSLLLAVVVMTPFLALGTDSGYTNYGSIFNGNIPSVDATNFYNYGTWDISGFTVPYKTSHTLNYVNTGGANGAGTMVGSVGWEFDYGPLPMTGGRGWSASFANNGASAIIQAVDGSFHNPPNSPNFSTASYLWVSATNIVNTGVLLADANGQIIINGGTVNLSRGQLLITNVLAGGGFIGGTNFALDAGLYAEYWGQASMPTNLGVITLPIMNSAALWNGSTVTTPTYGEQDNCSSNYFAGPLLSFTPTVADFIDNTPTPTNEYLQAVFVKVSDPGIIPHIRFTRSSNPTNYLETVGVQLAATLTNPFTLSTENNAIYVADMLGSETNQGLYINTNSDPFYTCSGSAFQPANYIVSRSDPVLPNTGLLAFGSGAPGAGSNPPSAFFYGSNMVNLTVTNEYSAYTVYVDDLAQDPAGAAVTNLPGFIQINANNLNLNRTWVGAQGSIQIQASNLVSSVGAVVDCQNLSFNLGSTNGFLNVTNLAKQEVSRFRGTLHLWSATWTNTEPVMIGTNATTNVINLAITVVDASQLSSTVPVTVQNLVLHSTNSTLSDSLTVDQTLLLDGQNFTLLGQLFLSGTLLDWTGALAPSLLNFTNDGVLYVPNNAHFGDDTAMPYAEFVNNGTASAFGGIIESGSQTIDSSDLQIADAINYTFSGVFSAIAGSIEITGVPSFFPYSIYSSSDIDFQANSLVADQTALYANGALNFNVTNSLTDNGTASSFYCYNGLNLWIKPQTGDLLGSTITSVASGNNAVVNSTWAGQDRGTNWAGFTNNVALGTLVLSAQNYLSQYTPLFVFSGTTGSNAMYVTTLDLSQLTTNPANVASMIQINPGMKIYVAQVILGFTPPGGQSPIGYLQSQFPGQIVALPNIVVTQSGSVDWNTTYQAIDGFGASSAYDGSWSTSQADILFSTNMGVVYYDNHLNFYTNNGIGLSLLRNHIVWASTPLASDTPTTVETNIMLMAQARGARVWSTPWTPAAGFKSIYDIYDNGVATAGGIDGGSFRGGTATNLAYASQLANYVVSMKNMGINLYAISIQNEPDAVVTTYDACQWTGTQIHDFVTNLYAALVAKGVGSTKIILPESQNWQDYQDLAGPAMADPTVAADVGIIGDHNYDGANGPANLTKNSYGKPLWETEVSQNENNDIANGVYYADRIYQFLTVAQASAWHYWWIFPYGSETGLMAENGGPTKRMFTVGQFSRFVRPGYVRIGANAGGGDLLVTAFKDTNSQSFAIVAINTNANIDVTQTFNLANVLGVSAVTPWMTSSSNSLAQLPSVEVSGSAFTYKVPAQSVVTFVGQGNAAPSNITISGTSYTSIGNSFVLTWNSTAGATYSVLKTNVLGGSTVNWPVLVTGYPTGGAAGGSLSYTDTTATAGPAFYRVRSP